MDAFLRHADEILQTAVEARDCGTPEYLISVSREGSVRMLSETGGWSLPALAAEHGAVAVYRIARRWSVVRVEGWSVGRTCLLTREASSQRWQM